MSPPEPIMDGGPERVAIIGMSCRLPGNIATVQDFWRMLSGAQSAWSTIPAERYSTSAYHHPNPGKKGCFNAKGGYYLSQDPALFDAPFFSLTREEAEAMGMPLT
jgi:acyl transferase domain-containing protein